MYNETHKNKERKRIKEMTTMKKIMIKILCGVITFAMAFSVVGCDKTDEMQSKLAQLEERIAEQNDEIADLQDENDKLQADLAEQTQEIKDLQTENDKLQADLADTIEENNEMSSQLAGLKKQGTFFISSGIYQLDEAEQNGWITEHDKLSIRYYNSEAWGTHYYWKDVIYEGKPFEPKPKFPTTINPEIQEAFEMNLTNSGISFYKLSYLGVYNGMYAFSYHEVVNDSYGSQSIDFRLWKIS
jgi:cell division protein FtsL